MTAERTALYERHVALGGKMVDFGGWDMPQQYSTIRDEHLAVRKAAGLFDVSHMGRLDVQGADAEAGLNRIFTNDLSALAPGHSQYTLMCRTDGGVIDDLVVYRRAADRFLVVVNASNRAKDVAWIREHLPAATTMTDCTHELSLIAFQGPQAEALLPTSSPASVAAIPYFGFGEGTVAGAQALISRTGYTGEDGFELFIDSVHVGRVWDAILEKGADAGVLPAGLGARDATRLEAALRLYGNDMDEGVNPYEAGLGWTVKLKKADFVGRETLAKIKEQGPRRVTIGLTTEPQSIPRHSARVWAAGREVGVVTSGTYSFFLGHPIALARVEAASFPVGSDLEVEVRGRGAPAKVAALPFYRGSAKSAAATPKTQ